MDTALPEEAVPHYGLQTVNRLTSIMGTRHETTFISFSIDAIRDLVDNWDYFKANTITAKAFLDEVKEHLRDCRPDGGLSDEVLNDSVLSIVECLANIFREAHLRQPTRQLSSAQASLMRFFEECGEWSKGDGNSATDSYYFVIPGAVRKNE